jgi:hypothetical protein
MKRIRIGLIAGVVVALATPVALAAATPAATSTVSKAAHVVIRHQVHGCHTWSFAGGAFKAAQVGRIARGGAITVINNDVMPQKLFKTSGPAVRYSGSPAMNRMGTSVKVSFLKAGVYTFRTKAGEDYSYAKNSKTTGSDNNLTLKIIVS